MLDSLTKLRPFTVAIMAGLLISTAVFVSDGRGEITTTGGPKADTSKMAVGGEQISPDTPLRVQCWQEGREIIDQRGLYGMSLRPLLEQASVSFKRSDAGGPDVHIISVNETTCIVQGE